MAWIPRIVFWCSLLTSAWLGMQLVHELGHVLAAWITGGSVQRVVFHPLTISRTDVSPNPAPLAVAWAGPLVGTVLPALAAVVGRWLGRTIRSYAEFFAGFCGIANGLYIGAGSFEGVGDAGNLLRNGVKQDALLLFGAMAFALGLWIWNRVSADFGLGRNPRIIGRSEAAVAAAAAAAFLTLSALLGSSN